MIAARFVVEPASDVQGFGLFLATAVGNRYRMRVADDGSVIILRHRD